MKPDPQPRARELCIAAGVDPDSRLIHNGVEKPAWSAYIPEMMAEWRAAKGPKPPMPQPDKYKDARLTVIGEHEPETIAQMNECMRYGNVVGGVLCADGHLGYAQPVGGVIAYEDQISISGVGFDIGCGNMAVKLDTQFDAIKDRLPELAADIKRNISFGIGRVNDERVDHSLFDEDHLWRAADLTDYKEKARDQLGTVGGGNHYVDIFRDRGDNTIWIGVHFGSRGLGHSAATKYLKLAGGRDGINVPPAIVDAHSEIGNRYAAAMALAGMYASAGREWVVERVRKMVGGEITFKVHNHHNYAWLEEHDGRNLYVVRKGATPAHPGQYGFIGGSMGDDAVIVRGVAHTKSIFRSTIHGAGRRFGRKEAKRRFTRQEMDDWLMRMRVIAVGGDLDESPMAYKRLPDVLDHHAGTIQITNELNPVIVAMAGEGEFDPWKD